MIRRFPDWRPRLVARMAEAASRPFAYGTHDCALFVADALFAMTGHDAAAEYRGRYNTIKSGLKATLKAGCADHVDVYHQLLQPVAPAFAVMGDIAVIPMAGSIPALGIFEGGQVIVLRESGLGLLPRDSATAAFRVP